MARYYEETALIEFVKQYTPHINGETTMQCVERAIRNAPTADVVPKSEVDSLKAELEDRVYSINSLGEYLENAMSEVERLEHILDCYALQYGTVTNQREAIDKVKAEVAGEIFEEIEKHLVFNAYGIAVISDKTFEEIKNKYMGVKNDR